MKRALGITLVVLFTFPVAFGSVVSCEKSGAGGGSKGPPTASNAPASGDASSTTATASSDSDGGGASGKIPAAADPNAPSRPEHLVIRVTYLADAGVPESSMMELEREGAYRLERRGGVSQDRETSDPKDFGSQCSGTLSADVGGALWKAIDAAAFVPAESGFAKPVQAPRQQNNQQQAKYSVIRILSDLSMVPSDENSAKALVTQIRTAISTAEKQAASSGTCTKLPRR